MSARSTVTKASNLEQDRAIGLRAADRVIESIRGRDAGRPRGKAVRRGAARLALPTARDLEISAATRMVEDPDKPAETVEVQFSRRADLLAEEHAHRRISESAFAVGRDIQASFEVAARVGGCGTVSMGMPLGSGASVNTTMHARQVDKARRATAEMERLRREVGEIGARFLRCILADGTTFQEYAAQRGHHGERAVTDVAKRFRWLLDEIAEKRAARGKVG